jgi:hypothetical protein
MKTTQDNLFWRACRESDSGLFAEVDRFDARREIDFVDDDIGTGLQNL